MGLFGKKQAETPEDNQVVRDAGAMAVWIAKALSQSGYKADLSLESLREIDRFFEEHASAGVARPDGLLSQDFGKRIFALGSYCGEVVRRVVGGKWSVDPADPAAEVNIQLTTGSGGICWPVQRVIKRFQLGPEEGLYAWGYSITLPRS
jgi:hypothetical protein